MDLIPLLHQGRPSIGILSHPSLWCIHPLGLGKVLGPYLCFVFNFRVVLLLHCLSVSSILLQYCFALKLNYFLHLPLFCNEYFNHIFSTFILLFLLFFIYSSAFLGSFCGACLSFQPLICCLSILIYSFSHVSLTSLWFSISN